jgi:hypothetical protein
LTFHTWFHAPLSTSLSVLTTLSGKSKRQEGEKEGELEKKSLAVEK